MSGRSFMLAAAFLGVALPAQAWVAGAEGAVCTLEHTADAGDVRLTYDPSRPLYTISIRRAAPWPEAPVFAMRFVGPRANLITTTRHVLSDGGHILTVTDRGFGNVLDGLQFNAAALAVAGETTVAIDLDGAAPEVAAFRACVTRPVA
jgi:hypothetical protein